LRLDAAVGLAPFGRVALGFSAAADRVGVAVHAAPIDSHDWPRPAAPRLGDQRTSGWKEFAHDRNRLGCDVRPDSATIVRGLFGKVKSSAEDF